MSCSKIPVQPKGDSLENSEFNNLSQQRHSEQDDLIQKMRELVLSQSLGRGSTSENSPISENSNEHKSLAKRNIVVLSGIRILTFTGTALITGVALFTLFGTPPGWAVMATAAGLGALGCFLAQVAISAFGYIAVRIAIEQACFRDEYKPMAAVVLDIASVEGTASGATCKLINQIFGKGVFSVKYNSGNDWEFGRMVKNNGSRIGNGLAGIGFLAYKTIHLLTINSIQELNIIPIALTAVARKVCFCSESQFGLMVAKSQATQQARIFSIGLKGLTSWAPWITSSEKVEFDALK